MMRSRRPGQEAQPSPTHPINGNGRFKFNHRMRPRHHQSNDIHDEDDYPPCCCFQSRKVTLGIFFGLLLSSIIIHFAKVNSSVFLDTQEINDNPQVHHPTESPIATASRTFQRPVRKWAYTFFLGGVPTIQNNETALNQAGYRGLLYNVLVSVKILRDSGSQADMILMVHMAEPYASLPDRDAQMLQKLNIKTYYVPPTLPSSTNGISTIALEKFRILDLVHYSRILYLESDVMPHCNLDYLFELSEPSNSTKTRVLQQNMVISTRNSPAYSSLFMLKPNRGYYQRFLRIFADYPDFFEQFNQTEGWGHCFNAEKEDAWLSVATLTRAKKDIKWNFPGADLDQGLLYHWVRYIRKKVSLVIDGTIVNIVGNNQTKTSNSLRKYSCLTEEEEKKGGRGNQWYADAELKKLTSPFGKAPYRDFAQWEHNDNKPWMYKKAPSPSLTSNTTRRRWFEELRQLDKIHSFQLGLYDAEYKANKDPQGESLNAEVANWRYIPRQKAAQQLPIWSTKVHALKHWAKQQSDSETRERLWQPPTLTMVPDAHRQNLFSQQSTPDKSTGQDQIPPIPCNCSNPIHLDPCSLPDQSFEEWLQPRLGLQFSKHRPACPDGARHHMHVVLPFANLKLDMVQAAYCSVQCQDYPSNKISIYVYEDGADEANKEEDAVLPHICGDKGVADIQPPVAANAMASNTKTHEEFDAAAQKWADETMNTYRTTIEPTKYAMVTNTICLRSSEHSGPGGGKYWAFRLVQARAEANDIVVVLDGDDELNTPKALQIVNRKYIMNSAWMTYGSHAGKYSEQTAGMPRAVLEGNSAFNPRKDSPSWRFGHTRTFKAHLLRHVGRKDFVFKDNSWLVKATDRGFVYRMLELSGPDRVVYIREALYKYKWNASSSTVASIPKEIRVANLEHVQSLEPSQRMTLPIHIVIVCWSRVYLLKEQLVWLQEQTLAQNRQLVVHLLSNNPKSHPDVVDTVGGFREKQAAGSFPNSKNIQVKIIESQYNWHAFSRFLYIAELRKTEPMDLVIFVDDDQYWVPNFLTSLLSNHNSRGMTTWYGKTFSKSDPSTGLADYWASDVTWSSIVVKNLTNVRTFAYGGPGGSVFDTNIWLFDQQLLRLKHDLKQYYEFDDCWASYVIDALLGWEHRRLIFPLPVDIANLDHPQNQVAILPNLPPGQADKLLKLNQAIAAKLKAVATYSGEARGSKTEMFLDMQSHFRWDVTRPNDSPLVKSYDNALEESNKQIGVSPCMPNDPPKKPKRAFVCVTGQFERLELQNKIDNLLLPIVNLGYKVQVALVLSGGETTFTNEGHGKLAKFRPKDKLPFYEEIPSAVAELENNGINVISPKDAIHGTYEKLANPRLHQQYLMGLYEIQKEARTFAEQKERVKNHPRIYESYQRCLAYAEKAVDNANEKAVLKDPERANNPYTLQTYYDVFFRIRDDVGFKDKLSTKMISTLLEPPPRSVTVTGCRGWHGMNDRFASVSPDVAHTYFSRPYDIFSKEVDLKDHVVMNPETFLLYSYFTAGINVYANKELKGITRMYKDANTGKAEFYGDDLRRSWCMTANNHADHVVGLYGWDVT